VLFNGWLVLHATCNLIVELLAMGFLGDKEPNRKQNPQSKQTKILLDRSRAEGEIP